MISKNQIKFVQSLHQKKYRQMYGKFLVEGHKTVLELLSSGFKIDSIYATAKWISENKINFNVLIAEVTEAELQKIATHENPQEVIAVANIPASSADAQLKKGKYIALDQINDPGNAGTIIRIADWFGLDGVIFSENSVDVFNPKVVSAAKGSLFRVPFYYMDLEKCFAANGHFPVLGTFMEGESIYSKQFPTDGILLIGNEANGISESLSAAIQHRISIPKFGQAESLNAGVAAGILISEWKKQA